MNWHSPASATHKGLAQGWSTMEDNTVMDKQQQSRRRFLQWTGLAAGGAVLAACAPTATPAPAQQPAQPAQPAAAATATPVPAAPTATAVPAPAKVVEVRVQDWGGDWQEVAKPQFDAFMQGNSDVKVVYEPYQDGWEERTMAAMVAGSAPEIIHAWGDVFRPFSDRGQLLNLEDLFQTTYTDAEKADFHPYMIEAMIRDGFRWAMPKHVWLGIMYYDKDKFDEAGVAYPDETWTHDDYEIAADKLTVREGSQTTRWGTYIPAWAYDRLVPRILAFGGEVVDQATYTQCLLGEPKAVEAIEWLRKRMWDDNTIAQQLQVENKSGYDSLIAGAVAMAEEGSSNLLRTAKGYQGNFDIALLPTGPARRCALGGTNGYALYKGAVERGTADAAWKVMQLLCDPDFQVGMVKAVSRTIIPCRVSAVSRYVTELKNNNPELANVNVDVITRGLGMEYAEAIDPYTFKKHAAAAEIITPALQSIFIVGDGPSDLFAELKDDIEATQS
jgi:multiple sugar transport system substrate-binding protein